MSLKLRLLWHLLRGRPLAYRLHFDGERGLVYRENGPHLLVVDCTISGTKTAVSVETDRSKWQGVSFR